MSGNVLIVVQAPANARLLPGRATAEVADLPYLELLVRRLQPIARLAPAKVLLATSDQPADEPVVDLATRLGIPVVRGDAADPLGQFAMALVRHPADTVIRIAGDSPLADPFVVGAALDLHRTSGADHTSNLLPRTYPAGLEVEVFSARALRVAELEADDPIDRVQVTSFIYRRPERFKLANLVSGHDLAEESWRVDTPSDLDRVRAMARAIADPLEASWNRILSVTGRTRKPRPGQVVLRPLESAAPGSAPWIRTWSVDIDGRSVGTVEVRAVLGRAERVVQVAEPWVEPAREALYRLLLDDQQTRT